MGSNLYRRKDSPYWWCNVYDANGVRRPKSTRCTDKRAAEAKRRFLERQAQDPKGYPSPHATSHTVEDALNYFVEHGCEGRAPRTVECYEQKGSQVSRLIGDEECYALTAETFSGFIAKRDEEGAARETVRKEIVVLRQALTLAETRELAPEGISRLVPRMKVLYKPRKRNLPMEEVDKILPLLADDSKRFWLLVAIYTGGSLSELRRLRVEDVDNPEGWIFVDGTKRPTRRRHVPIAPGLRKALKRYAPKAGLLLAPWGNVDRDLKKACETAGIAPISPNDLRRTFGSWMVQGGTPLKAVASLMGHSTTRMVDLVYGQLADRNLVEAVQAMPAVRLRSKYVATKAADRAKNGACGEAEKRRNRA